MPRIPNRRDDDREPTAPEPATPIAEAPPAPVAPAVATPPGDLPPLPTDQEGSDPAVVDVGAAPPPPSAPLPPIVPTEVHEAEADLLLADAEDPPRAAPARGWRADAQRIYRMVSDELLLVTGGKRLPTIDEIDRAIEGAVARSAPRRGEAAPALPQASSETEAAADRLAAEALDPAWAGDPAVVARARHAVKEMLGSGASEDEVRGMLAETDTRDWLNQYAAQIGEEWGGEDVGEPAADLIPAAWQSQPAGAFSTSPPSPAVPSPVTNAQLPQSASPLSTLTDANAVQSMVSDAQRRSRYFESERNLPARLNDIILTPAEYRAARDYIHDVLKILPDSAQVNAQAAKSSPKKGQVSTGTINPPPAVAGGKGTHFGGQKSVKQGAEDAWKKSKAQLLAKPMHFRLSTPNVDARLRASAYDIGVTTALAKAHAVDPGERYAVIAERISDGQFVVVSVATGGTQGGSANGMTGFDGGPKLPNGYRLRALLHTHDVKGGVDAIPGPGDPSAVWAKDIPVFIASYDGDVNKPFKPSRFSLYEVNRAELAEKSNPQRFRYRTVVHKVDISGNAIAGADDNKWVKKWQFDNWKVNSAKK